MEPSDHSTTKHTTAVLAQRLVAELTASGHWLAVAESCTGGLLGATLTDVPGASACFFGGVISYANEAKERWLGVEPALLTTHGAVSEEVARAMVEGLLRRPTVDLACAVTGIAGPGGATPGKPVGTVYIAVGAREGITVERHHFGGDRTQVRAATVAKALEMLLAQPSPAGDLRSTKGTNGSEMVEIFTDGGCRGNPGPGGWGAVLRYRGREKELSGGDPQTTNNRMEMLAAIRALESLKRPSRVVLTTDSTYLKQGITSWIDRWKRNGWRTANRKPVKNEDLWRRLDAAASRHRVEWHWVKGHAGHPENERADALANRAMDELTRK